MGEAVLPLVCCVVPSPPFCPHHLWQVGKLSKDLESGRTSLVPSWLQHPGELVLHLAWTTG
ncbi:mCG147519 [Mus musculus]|nr:mCG147519 [Mus musculus]